MLFPLDPVSLKAVDPIAACYLHLHYEHHSCCPKHLGSTLVTLRWLQHSRREVGCSAPELSYETCLLFLCHTTLPLQLAEIHLQSPRRNKILLQFQHGKTPCCAKTHNHPTPGRGWQFCWRFDDDNLSIQIKKRSMDGAAKNPFSEWFPYSMQFHKDFSQHINWRRSGFLLVK